ncbi:hypothetical protein LCGC14_1645960 [marine sediment metagenome]|uniref:HNH nuclease domain-containing protein n=1 Tax=marine sediment metagenome TaxID=412755 RepID=A0A0F9HY72_9ZZZZ
MTKYRELEERVALRHDDNCWEWSAHDSQGYASIHFQGRTQRAHVLAYILRYGPVPTGLELDHTCNNRGCWNPDHVEPVTHRVNLRRSPNGNWSKTHCPRGHPYDEANTYRDRRDRRYCRACNRERQRIPMALRGKRLTITIRT